MSVVAAGLKACGLLLIVASLQAQQPTFRSGVQLVRVDAVVTDAQGNAVRGLARDDFELYDRGQPQTIQAFSEIHHDRPQTSSVLAHRDVASNAVSDSSRLVVLVLDDYHIRPEWTDRTRQVTKDFLLSLGDRAMMALLSSSGKYDVELTEDRSRIFDVIDRFTGNEPKIEVRSPGGLTSGLLGPSPEHPTDQKTPPHDPIDSALQLFFRPLNVPIPVAATARVRPRPSYVVSIPLDSETFFKLLENASRMLGGEEERRKAFVWVSTGLPYGMKAAQEAWDAMRRAGVATHAIDPVGTSHVVSGGAYDGLKRAGRPTPWDEIAAIKRRSLTETSRQSGGVAVVNDDDLEGGVRRIVQDLDNYYLLGFAPDDVKTPGVRTLSLRVRQPGLTVRNRLSYAIQPPSKQPARASVLAVAQSLVPKSDLPLRLQAVALPDSARQSRVLVALEVTASRAALTDAAGRVGEEIKYGVMAVSLKSGHITATAGGDAKISLPSGGEVGASAAFTIETSLTLPPGPYQLRASATSTALNRSGSVYLSFDAPDFTRDAIAVSDLLIGPSRVVVAEDRGLAALKAVRSIPFAPSLDREFSRTDETRVYFEITRKTPGTVHLSIEAVDGQDRVTLLGERDLNVNGRAPADMTLRLAALEPGGYRLRVTVTEGPNLARREVGILVR